MATILKAGLPPPASRPAASAILPPIRYATAAAAAVAPLTPSSSLSATTLVPTLVATTSPNLPPPLSIAPSIIPPASIPPAVSQDQQSAVLSSPSLTQFSVTSPMLSSAASASQQPDGSFYSGQESPALSEAISTAGKPPLSPQQESAPRKGLLICFIMSSQFQCITRFRIFSLDPGSDP
jgi:CCR4-NOT transcription complex subunit 3